MCVSCDSSYGPSGNCPCISPSTWNSRKNECVIDHCEAFTLSSISHALVCSGCKDGYSLSNDQSQCLKCTTEGCLDCEIKPSNVVGNCL